jgi:hypothetical protein
VHQLGGSHRRSDHAARSIDAKTGELAFLVGKSCVRKIRHEQYVETRRDHVLSAANATGDRGIAPPDHTVEVEHPRPHSFVPFVYAHFVRQS